MLLAASTLIVSILIAGYLLRHRRAIHIRLMIAAFSLDLALVLVIELTRGAIRQAVSSPPPLLLFHITMSVFSLLFYVAMAVLGNGVRRGREDWRPYHRSFSWMFGVCRSANYITSWMI